MVEGRSGRDHEDAPQHPEKLWAFELLQHWIREAMNETCYLKAHATYAEIAPPPFA